MGRLPKGLPKPGQITVGEGGAHGVCHIDPGQTVGPEYFSPEARFAGVAVIRILIGQIRAEIFGRESFPLIAVGMQDAEIIAAIIRSGLTHCG